MGHSGIGRVQSSEREDLHSFVSGLPVALCLTGKQKDRQRHRGLLGSRLDSYLTKG